MVEIVEEKKQCLHPVAVFESHCLLKIVHYLQAHRLSAIGVELSLKDVAKDEKIVIGGINAHVTLKLDDFLVTQPGIGLQNFFYVQIGGAAAVIVGIDSGIGELAIQHKLGCLRGLRQRNGTLACTTQIARKGRGAGGKEKQHACRRPYRALAHGPFLEFVPLDTVAGLTSGACLPLTVACGCWAAPLPTSSLRSSSVSLTISRSRLRHSFT